MIHLLEPRILLVKLTQLVPKIIRCREWWRCVFTHTIIAIHYVRNFVAGSGLLYVFIATMEIDWFKLGIMGHWLNGLDDIKRMQLC